MNLISIDKQKPEQNQIVLIKTKEDWLPYYICKYYTYYLDKTSYFEEAGGEQYCRWEEDEVEGWIPIEDIEKYEIVKCGHWLYAEDYKDIGKIVELLRAHGENVMDAWTDTFYCSECCKKIDAHDNYDADSFKYCPYCGAKMNNTQ